MTRLKTIKVSNRIAVILLIAIFSIVGIVACGGAQDISASNGEGFVVNPDKSDSTDSTGPTETPGTSGRPCDYPENTYWELYAPFVTWDNTLPVSYLDTNTLSEYWRKHIKRAGSNDNTQWIIRDGDNRRTDPRDGNYYYFDKNMDIVYMHQTDNNKYQIKVKEFLGGVIVRYNIDFTGKVPDPPVYTIGGLYRNTLNRESDNSKGEKGYTKYDNSPLNEFMREIHHWGEGDLTVLLMNVGYATIDFRYNMSFPFSYEFGVDEYYCTVDGNYRKDPTYFLGQNPTNYLGVERKDYWHEKLNVRVNHSHYLDRYNFRFTIAEAYDWWDK